MKLTRTTLSIFVLFISLSACTTHKEIIVANTSDSIHYMGRIDHSDSSSIFYWSGTSAKINFEGKSISAVLKDETGNNYYNVIIDEDSILIVRPSNKKEIITLANNLKDGHHSVELFKRTEYDRGQTKFYGFMLGKGATLLSPDPVRKRKIEFYGNSITCGYAVDDTTGADRPDSIFTNNYKSYANITARYFDAEYHCTAKSGIGITISWFPTIMPDIYDRVDPRDEASQWDFSKFTPDVVVVNLMQNDSWLVNRPDHPSFEKYFGTKKPSEEYIINAYKNFVSKLREKYPNAEIICTMGGMDATREGSAWPGYVDKAIGQMNDSKIHSYFMPYKQTPGHPYVEEQKTMAKGLIQFIDENIEW